MASYNKNPAAANDPDGIVAVWNLHLLERPEFVFHSPVSRWLLVHLLTLLVRCPFGDVLSVSPDIDFRWLVLWPGALMGYSRETSACAQDTIILGRAHIPDIRHENGRNAERE